MINVEYMKTCQLTYKHMLIHIYERMYEHMHDFHVCYQLSSVKKRMKLLGSLDFPSLSPLDLLFNVSCQIHTLVKSTTMNAFLRACHNDMEN